MTEELNEGAAGVEGEAGDTPGQTETTPTTEPVAGKSDDAVQVPAEYTALIEQQVKAAVDAKQKEYEGEGGHLSKVKSTKDKEIAKLRQQLQQQQEVDRKRALDLMDSDPAEAARQLAAQNEAYAQQQQAQHFQGQMDTYINKTLEEYGLDAEDADIAKQAAEWSQRLMQDEKLGADFQHAMGQVLAVQKDKALEQKDEEVAQLQKQLDAQAEEIHKAVARAMEDAGIGKVDLSPDGSPGKSDSVHGKAAGKNVQDGIAAARKEMKRRQQ